MKQQKYYTFLQKQILLMIGLFPFTWAGLCDSGLGIWYFTSCTVMVYLSFGHFSVRMVCL